MLSDTRESIALLEKFHALSTCLSKSSIKMNVSTEYRGNDNDRGN
jgi:hypothetical protein